MGGRHSNVARSGVPSHFALAMGALVWRSPTGSELCNSHRAKRHSPLYGEAGLADRRSSSGYQPRRHLALERR
jgi:hypothetical protein